jgi:hypothetical protein
MTKGQNKTVEFIEQFVESNSSKFTWQELVNEVQHSGAIVKNWLTIRGVLQWFMNEGLIKRNRSDLNVEEYVKA